MNNRINKTAIALAVLLVLSAIALFTYTLVSAPTTQEPEELSNTQTPSTERVITAQHQYRGGIHTIAGTVDLPTPCHKLVVEPFFTTPNEVVELRFTTTVAEEACAQVITPTPFKVTFEAPETVRIGGMLDGDSVRLNLVPVGPDSSIDDGLYIKG